MDQVVVLVKPDGVRRGLSGEVIKRFEHAGLRVAALKMIWVDESLLSKHYTDDKEYVTNLGRKTLKNYEEFGRDPNETLGTSDPYKIGKMIRKWTIDYIKSGPVVAMLLTGRHAVKKARTLAGVTMPVDSPPGTIRGDFGSDSAYYGNTEKRAVLNVVHVSGTDDEADFERKLWFREKEIYEYNRVDVE